MKAQIFSGVIPALMTPCKTDRTPDFDALVPFMDLVGSAAENTGDEPEVIGNEETTLSTAFLAAFFNIGLTSDTSLGITEDMLSDTEHTDSVTPVFK